MSFLCDALSTTTPQVYVPPHPMCTTTPHHTLNVPPLPTCTTTPHMYHHSPRVPPHPACTTTPCTYHHTHIPLPICGTLFCVYISVHIKNTTYYTAAGSASSIEFSLLSLMISKVNACYKYTIAISADILHGSGRKRCSGIVTHYYVDPPPPEGYKRIMREMPHTLSS